MMDQKKIQELIGRSQQEDAVAFSLLVSTFQRPSCSGSACL